MSRRSAQADATGIEELMERLGYRFRDAALLARAVTHVSYANETMKDPGRSYERLEFLGDALLGFIVAHVLYEADPAADEGVLTRRKQIVVRTATLAQAAERIGLGEALRLSRGETATGGRRKHSLLADAFEAVVAAVYLDGGIRAARTFVRGQLGPALREATASTEVGEDFKTRLQELVQAELRHTPAYRIVSRTGPDHEQRFRAEVRVDGRLLGVGTGTSRKRAEQAAAAEALRELDSENPEESR